MPATIVVTSVGNLDATEWGTHEVANAAQGCITSGADTLRLGGPRVSPDLPGRNIAFEFTLLAAPPPTDNNLFFGTQSVISEAGGDDQLLAGIPAIQTVAATIAPTGSDFLRLGYTLVVDAALTPQADFDFVDFYALDHVRGRAMFYWGPTTIFGSGFDSLQVGTIERVQAPQLASPAGFASAAYGTAHRVADTTRNGIDISFNLVDLADPNAPNFNFGEDLVAYKAGDVFTAFGKPAFANVAQGIFAVGIDAFGKSSRTWARWGSYHREDFYFIDYTYVTPSAQNVPFYFWGPREATCFGHISMVFGDTLIADRVRELHAFGSRMTQWGAATIYNLYDDLVAAVGIPPGDFGQATLLNNGQIVYVYHFDPQFTQWGLPKVGRGLPRQVYPLGIAAPALPTQDVSHFLRWLTVDNKHPALVVGTPAISFRVRTIVQSINNTFLQVGTPRVGEWPKILPEGFTREIFGEPDVDWANVLRPTSITSTFAVGSFGVTHNPQVVLVAQTPTFMEFGRATHTFVYNSRQYVQHIYDPDNTYESEFGTLWIKNRNRVIAPFGHTDSRFSNATLVEAAAVPLFPVGIEGTKFGSAYIAYFLQSLAPTGIHKEYVSPYHAIYNTARLVVHTGWASDAYGRPGPVFSNQQTIRHHTPSQTEWGTAFVAYRIRSVEQILSQNTMWFGATVVSLYENYIAPKGFVTFGAAAPTMIGPFKRTLKPASILAPAVIGPERVWNKTPQLYPGGFFAGRVEYPQDFRVEFRVRPVQMAGVTHTQWGNSAVKDRRQWVTVGGFLSEAIPISHDAFREGADPPSNRIISVSGYDAQDDRGVLIGRLTIQGQPYPVGFVATAFGTTWIRVQGCKVAEWEWPDSQWRFGLATLNRPIVIKPSSEYSDFMVVPKARVSPHTIWATTDTPMQAKLNHPPPSYYPIDLHPWLQYTDKPFFGRPMVALRNRRIYHHHSWYNSYGDYMKVPNTLNVDLKRRVIYATGTKLTRFGWPSLPSLIIVDAFGEDMAYVTTANPPAIVGPHVGRVPGTIQICPLDAPTDHMRFGRAEAQNWIRNIYTRVDPPHTQWGNNTPMVHFPRKLYPQGFSATQWGDEPWIDYRIRVRYFEGWDSFESEMTPGWYKQQLRVWRKEKPRVAGFDAGVVGTPAVGLKSQWVYPYMIAPPNITCSGGTVTNI